MQTTTAEGQKNIPATAPLAYLRDDFYRDGFQQILLSLGMLIGAIGLLICVSLYFFLHQVLPVTFPVYGDWRVQAEVPLEVPYLSVSDLMQWTTTTLNRILAVDFLNYNEQLKKDSAYFTARGYEKFLELAKVYLPEEDVVGKKQFVHIEPTGAPVLINQGLVEGKYGWWVQMPLDVLYSGIDGQNRRARVSVQVLVLRISTLNNLDGVAIDNILLTQS